MSICLEGRVALASFTTFSLLSFYQLNIFFGDYWSYKYCLLTFACAISCTFFLPYRDIVQRAALLGTMFGSSIIMIKVNSCPWITFWMYMMFLSFFHFSEYMMTALYNSHRLSTDSFLLNHSTEYQLAAVASWVEFTVEAYFFPTFKCLFVLNVVGFFLVVCGELLRKLAMIVAKANFSHIVQSEKNAKHELVTNGIYSWMRHPSYVGWFYWSIGTQILLCNPLCTIAYTMASWSFFNERIRDEEYHLIQFFGEDYKNYILNVPTLLPFIYGLQQEVKESKRNT